MNPRVMLLALGLALPVLTVLPGAARAQQGNIQITFAPVDVAFPTPDMADFDTGWVDHAGFTVSITSRPRHVPWELRLQATDPTLGGYGKPLGDVLWRINGGPWQPLSAQDLPLLQGVGDTDVVIQFRMRLDWLADVPGDYGTGLTFTALRP